MHLSRSTTLHGCTCYVPLSRSTTVHGLLGASDYNFLVFNFILLVVNLHLPTTIYE